MPNLVYYNHSFGRYEFPGRFSGRGSHDGNGEDPPVAPLAAKSYIYKQILSDMRGTKGQEHVFPGNNRVP